MVEVNISSSHWEWLVDHHLHDGGRRPFRDVYAEKQSLRAAASNRGEQQWYWYCGMGQLGDARASLTCAVTQTIPSLFSNTQGYHFSFPSSLDCFCHRKCRCSGFGREEAITPQGCSALQNYIRLGCAPEQLQHLWDSLGPCIQYTKMWYTITSASPCFSVHIMCLISC